jgi:hypothetical protein
LYRVIFSSFFIILLISSGVYSAINYSEYFPNGSTVVQSQSNGWTSPVNWNTKEIMTSEWCKKITSSQGQMIFIPTKTINEWNSFKNSVAYTVSISECYTYAWNTGWWWSCSATCWWWTQSRVVNCQRNDGTTISDSYCTETKPTATQGCNTQVCPGPYDGWGGWYKSIAEYCPRSPWWYGPDSCPKKWLNWNTQAEFYTALGPSYCIPQGSDCYYRLFNDAQYYWIGNNIYLK